MQRLAVRTTILLVMAAGAAVAQPSVFYPAKGQTAYSTHRGHLFHAIVGTSSTPSRAG